MTDPMRFALLQIHQLIVNIPGPEWDATAGTPAGDTLRNISAIAGDTLQVAYQQALRNGDASGWQIERPAVHSGAVR